MATVEAPSELAKQRTRYNQGSPRNHIIHVAVNKDELEIIDKKRGSLPRAVYVRQSAINYPVVDFLASVRKLEGGD